MLELLVFAHYQLSKIIEEINYHLSVRSYDALPKETRIVGYIDEDQWHVKFISVAVFKHKKQRNKKTKRGNVSYNASSILVPLGMAIEIAKARPGLCFRCDGTTFRFVFDPDFSVKPFFKVIHPVEGTFRFWEDTFREFLNSKNFGGHSPACVLERTFGEKYSLMPFIQACEILEDITNELNNIGLKCLLGETCYIRENNKILACMGEATWRLGNTNEITRPEQDYGTWKAIDWHFRDEQALAEYLLQCRESTDSGNRVN